MALNIAETIELLFDKNNNVAYKALQNLQKESQETDCVYPYMDRLSDMLDSDNSYIRTRGLTLLAYNAKWDKDYKADKADSNWQMKTLQLIEYDMNSNKELEVIDIFKLFKQ